MILLSLQFYTFSRCGFSVNDTHDQETWSILKIE